MVLFSSVSQSLTQLIDLLNQLEDEQYATPIEALSNASMGQHIRHIIELFQCLLNQYDSGYVNYDKRERNMVIETDTAYAILCIEDIKHKLYLENKPLILEQFDLQINTNYHRELLYNLEHCIHHQALIKVAVLPLTEISLCPTFGVAPSTLEYRKQKGQSY